MKKYKALLIILSLCVILYFILSKLQMAYAISQYGSSGDEVKQIQTKLRDWGYYKGSIDGIYGSRNI